MSTVPNYDLLFVFWIDLRSVIDFSEKEVEALSESHDLCVGGDCIEMLQQTSAVLQVIPYVKVLIHTYVELVVDVVAFVMHIWIVVSGFCKSCS